MNHRSKARRLAAVRCPYVIVTALALGRATAQPRPKDGNYNYASRSFATTVGIQFPQTQSTNTRERVGNMRINPSDVAFRTMACHRMRQGSTIDSKSSSFHCCQVADKDGHKFSCGACEKGQKWNRT